MTLQEKQEFVAGLIETVEQQIMDKVGKVPENWDGYELRLFIKEHFSKVAWADMKGKRAREYKNICLINNLL